MDKNIRIFSTFLLAVEGKDECNFFKALLDYQNIKNVQIVDIGGKDKFAHEFPALYNLEGFNKVERLGFIRDAESAPAKSAFISICNILSKNRLPVPNQQNHVTANTFPRVGIFIMPDNAGTGMLENLCLETIKTHRVNSCIDTFIDCFSKYQEKNEKQFFVDPKARVQAYLATRSPIKNSLGLGALNGYWDFKHSCFNTIKDFLKSLFH